MDPRTHPLFTTVEDVDTKLSGINATFLQGFLTADAYRAQYDILLDLRIVLANNRILYGSE